MPTPTLKSPPSSVSISAASLSLAASLVTLLCLSGLHVFSPEFDPARRVVSEYALGQHRDVLSLMFLMWALSSWLLAMALRPKLRTASGKTGLVLLVVAGVGEAMASVFDVRSAALHGLAGALGVGSLPIAAMLISSSLGRSHPSLPGRQVLVWAANLTWMSLALLAAAMLTLTRTIGGLRVPIGWPNRLLVVLYVAWAILVAWQVIRSSGTDGGGAGNVKVL